MTHPLTLPAIGAAMQSFEPQRVDFLSPEAGGRVGAVSAGIPLWLGTWQLGKIGAAKSDAWRAFLLRLRGSQRAFYGYDLARRFPLAHIDGFAGMTRAGGGSFDGQATSWSQTIDSEADAQFTLTGLPVGLIVTPGDYVGFIWTNVVDRRALVRAVTGGVASAGGNVTFVVEPPVPTFVVPAGATAHLNQPLCLMKLVPGETTLGPIDRRLAVSSGTITAIQDLRA